MIYSNNSSIKDQNGKIGLSGLLFIAILAMVAHVLFVSIIPYYHMVSVKKNMRKSIREMMKYGGEEETRDYLLEKLDGWGIKYEPSEVYVWDDDDGFRHAKITYIEQVRYFGKWTYDFVFKPEVKIKKYK